MADLTVLGVWDGHDAGVALVRDGQLRMALSEERVSRRKRASGFPFEALQKVLRATSTDPASIDVVAFPGQYGRLAHRLGDALYRRSNPDRDPLSWSSRFVRNTEVGLSRIPGVRAIEKQGSERVLRARFQKLGIVAPVQAVAHHDAHAWTARLVATGDEDLIVTMDGYGDGLAGTFDAFASRRVELQSPSDSVALVYGAVTRVLGFGEGEEGKVMGLAAMGDPAPLRALFSQLIAPGACDPSLGGRSGRALLRSHPAADVAAALQERVEQVVLHWVSEHRDGRSRLAVAGGLFANVALNGKLARDFETIRVFPHMGDGGLCVGAAVAVAGLVPFKLPFLGPQYSEAEIDKALGEAGLPFTVSADPEKELLDAILEGGMVARFWGRSEFGPRALGHRSILMRADRPDLVDALNQRLGRDEFMPFAPIRRMGPGSATMTVVVPADPLLQERCPAAVHCDGTVRTQLVDPNADTGLWGLLERAEEKGLPALINTSFNRHGEPIVESPYDAIRTFLSADLDRLQLGNRIVRRPG